MNFAYCFAFTVAFLTNFSAAAFPQHGNLSKAETLIGNAKSANSLLADSSPGIQEGNNVGFIGTGPINLTLNKLVFVLSSSSETATACNSNQFGICYDAYSPDGGAGLCSQSQCFLEIHTENSVVKKSSTWNHDHNMENNMETFTFSDSSSTCRPKTENGMIQLNVHNFECPVKAKDAHIKYPEISSTTIKSDNAAQDSVKKASFWNEGGWIILVVVLCILVCILLGGGSVSLFYYLKKKKASVKAPPPPSIMAADKKTITMAQQPSVVMPNADLQKKKKKNDGKKVKVNAAAEKTPLKKNTQKITAAATSDVPKKRSSESVEDEFICRTDEWLPESALEELKKSRT